VQAHFREQLRRFLGGLLSPATLTQVLSEARHQVEARRQQPLSVGQYAALVGDAIHLRYRRRPRGWAGPVARPTTTPLSIETLGWRPCC